MESKRRCCGIDVHKKTISVCVLPAHGRPETEIKRRKFRTFTRDLKQLLRWLKNCQVTEVAMESTGQYWRSVWNLLEGHFEKLVLVNPQHIKGLNGYKTDPRDAQWIAGLLEGGKLRGSWVPPREIRELRDLTRQRVHLVEDLTRVKNRIEQTCQAGNIKISSVATELLGVSGRLMLHAIAEGEQSPRRMAEYAQTRLRGKRSELRLALEGSFTDNQRWLLEAELRQLEWLELQIEVLEREIERRMEPFAEPIRRVRTIPGIDLKTAWMIVAELGVDMSVFGDGRHLASWAGLCPGNRESGGKRLSGRTRKANRYVRRGMCQAAWAASHGDDTYLAAFYRRMRVRKGGQKAVMALAHHMITVVYNLLSRNEDYVELGGGYYDQRNKPKVVSRLVARLTKLGYYVDLRQADIPEGTVAAYQPQFQPPAQLPPPAQPQAEDGHSEAGSGPASGEPASQPAKRRAGRPCKCAERGLACKHAGRKGKESVKKPAPVKPVKEKQQTESPLCTKCARWGIACLHVKNQKRGTETSVLNP